jgi:steroid delta-isomerase-like uncharacterized protein
LENTYEQRSQHRNAEENGRNHQQLPLRKAPRSLRWFTQFHSAFPDFKIAVEHMVADDDNVAFAYTITGTHGGPFNGIPASGKKIKVRGMQISKFNSDAKITERWGASHEVGILQQIGAMKPVAHLDEPPVLSSPASPSITPPVPSPTKAPSPNSALSILGPPFLVSAPSLHLCHSRRESASEPPMTPPSSDNSSTAEAGIPNHPRSCPELSETQGLLYLPLLHADSSKLNSCQLTKQALHQPHPSLNPKPLHARQTPDIRVPMSRL